MYSVNEHIRADQHTAMHGVCFHTDLADLISYDSLSLCLRTFPYRQLVHSMHIKYGYTGFAITIHKYVFTVHNSAQVRTYSQYRTIHTYITLHKYVFTVQNSTQVRIHSTELYTSTYSQYRTIHKYVSTVQNYTQVRIHSTELYTSTHS